MPLEERIKRAVEGIVTKVFDQRSEQQKRDDARFIVALRLISLLSSVLFLTFAASALFSAFAGATFGAGAFLAGLSLGALSFGTFWQSKRLALSVNKAVDEYTSYLQNTSDKKPALSFKGAFSILWRMSLDKTTKDYDDIAQYAGWNQAMSEVAEEASKKFNGSRRAKSE